MSCQVGMSRSGSTVLEILRFPQWFCILPSAASDNERYVNLADVVADVSMRSKSCGLNGLREI